MTTFNHEFCIFSALVDFQNILIMKMSPLFKAGSLLTNQFTGFHYIRTNILNTGKDNWIGCQSNIVLPVSIPIFQY